MSSSGSLRDLNKAVNAFLVAPVLPLPDELTTVLDAFVNKHAEYNQSASDRLQDSLLSIFAKHVHGHPPANYIAFLAVMRRLRPVIRSTAHVTQWWARLVEPTLDFLGEEPGLSAGNAVADLVGFLAREGDEDEVEEAGRDATAESPIVFQLLQKWMDAVAAADAAGSAWTIDAGQAVFAGRHSRDSTKAQLVQDVLVQFGKIKPSDLFDGLDHFFVQAAYRSRAILFFTDFIRSQPPNLHIVYKSPLFDNVLRCLQHDTSTTVVSLALTLLTMLLPHMPVSIVPILPTLFNIYARLLFWDPEQLDSAASQDESATSAAATTVVAAPWDKCAYSPERDSPNLHHLLGYFTILYGLYPINFMDYIRKPHRYLRHANVADTDEVEVQPSEIRDRSETFRRCHMLHPNFYSLTIESEKTDFSRWMNCATADIVSECVSLYALPPEPLSLTSGVVAQRGTVLDGHGNGLADDTLCQPMDGEAMGGAVPLAAASSDPFAVLRRGSQSSYPPETYRRRSGIDSPTLPPALALSSHGSRTELRDMIESNRAIKSGIYQSLASDSVPSLSLSHQEAFPERPALGAKSSLSAAQTSRPTFCPRQTEAKTHAGAGAGADADTDADAAASLEENDGNGPDASDETSIEQMRRQILLLRNDLNFERYMVQQHLAHIGALRQRSMLQAVTEAETQNLILANRTLKHRLEEAKKTEAQVRKEAEMSRNRAKAWEATLSDKLRKLREEGKKWTAEGERLRRDLRATQADNARLVQLVCASELRELKTSQAMQMLKNTADETAQLKAALKAQTAAQWAGEPLAAQLARARQETAERERDVELLYLKLEAREAEMVHTREFYEKQVAELRAKLAGVLLQAGQRPAAGAAASTAALDEARALVESALAASRAKHLELQKNHTRLMRKYKVLESKYLEQATAMSYDPDYDYDHIGGDGGGGGGGGGSGPSRGSAMDALSDPGTESSGPYGSQRGGVRASIGGSSSIGSVGSGGSTPRTQQQPMTLDAPAPPVYWTGVGPGRFGRRPTTPPPGQQQSGSGPRPDTASAGSTSPQTERYFGRGGVQNSGRKERKDKKPDDAGDKKGKKPGGGSGIRAIRGFV